MGSRWLAFLAWYRALGRRYRDRSTTARRPPPAAGALVLRVASDPSQVALAHGPEFAALAVAVVDFRAGIGDESLRPSASDVSAQKALTMAIVSTKNLPQRALGEAVMIGFTVLMRWDQGAGIPRDVAADYLREASLLASSASDAMTGGEALVLFCRFGRISTTADADTHVGGAAVQLRLMEILKRAPSALYDLGRSTEDQLSEREATAMRALGTMVTSAVALVGGPKVHLARDKRAAAVVYGATELAASIAMAWGRSAR